MDLHLEGLRVFVSAGASGIGLAIVERFLEEGAQVATCDVEEAALTALAKNIPACIAIFAMSRTVPPSSRLFTKQPWKNWAAWIVWSIMPGLLALPQK